MQVKGEHIVRVWRVEHNTTRDGPYNGNDDIEPILGKHNHNNGHPAPKYDRGIMRATKDEELCGFINLKQAYQWFTKEELQRLQEEGFYLKRVIAKRITAVGEFQILFERR